MLRMEYLVMLGCIGFDKVELGVVHLESKYGVPHDALFAHVWW